MRIAAIQCRAARALLDWTLQDLARESGVAVDTIRRLEKGETLHERTNWALREALQKAGITFLDNGLVGVALRKDASQHKMPE
jgi:transcriptional regulator with XRE-family HTH domain